MIGKKKDMNVRLTIRNDKRYSTSTRFADNTAWLFLIRDRRTDMAVKTVSAYFIRHRIGDGKTFLTLHFEGGGSEVLNDLALNEAEYLIDLLRNEKPLIYDTTDKVLATQLLEPVGEGE